MTQPETRLTTRWSAISGLANRRLDPAAREELWEWFIWRYRPLVRSVLDHVVGRSAADAMIDDFWGHLFTANVFAAADRQRSFRRYLSGVARNFARDWLRRSKMPAPCEVLDSGELDKEETPDAAGLRPWAEHVLHLALESLAAQKPKDAFAIRRFYGIGPERRLNGVELAKMLGIELNTLHQRLHTARHALRSNVIAELRETVGDEADLDEEVRLFLRAIDAERPGLAG